MKKSLFTLLAFLAFLNTQAQWTLGNPTSTTYNVLIQGPNLGANDATLRLIPIGGGSSTTSQFSLIDFYSTFDNFPADQGSRRTASIKAGFAGGVWGNEYFAFHIGNNGNANDFSYLPIERMRISGNGNVGIGTPSPAGRLHLNDSRNLVNNATVDIILTQFDGWSKISGLYTGTQMGGIAFSTNNGLNTPVEERMRITASGSVGIGTASPKGKLHIAAPDESTSSAISIRQSNSDVYGFDIGLDQSLNGNMFFYRVYADTRHQVMEIDRNNGNIGIGTSPASTHKLAVEGSIGAREIKVQAPPGWPDYVFSPDYELPTLEETKTYIEENQHLPEIPSAAEMETNGVAVGEMNMLLLKKIEELTLYVIKLESKNIEQDKLIQNLLNNEK